MEAVQQHNQLQMLALEICMAEERERRRIAIGLHDEIGQLLVVARLKLGELNAVVVTEQAQELTRTLRDLLDQASSATRSATFELSSLVLHRLGLEAAVQGLADRISRLYGLNIRLLRQEHPLALTEDTLTVLFRAVRELLFNVHKHARARNVVITVASVDDQASVEVEDDGVGFEMPAPEAQFSPNGGFGLFSVSAQLQAMGGRLEVISAPGTGSRIVMSVPSVPATGSGPRIPVVRDALGNMAATN